MGIGIHRGEVIAGNIRSPNRLEYTVIGDPVNVTAQIGGLTKIHKTDILVSDEVVITLSGNYALTRLSRVRAQGREKSILLYKLR